MNIAIVGKFFEERAGLHIEEALIDIGHSVVKIDPEVNFMQYSFMGYRGKIMAKSFYNQFLSKIPIVRKIKSNSIYKQIENKKIDLTIVLHDYLSTQEVEKIKQLTSSPIVLWFPDAISNFKQSMFFVANYDYLFFVDKYIVEKLTSEFNLNIHYLPQCCNPSVHKKKDINNKEKEYYKCDITTAGNFYPSRIALFKNLSEYNIKVWGPKPPIWLKIPEIEKMIGGHIVINNEKSKAFNAAKVVLNNLHPAVINGVNKRMFEIPACAAFQITSHREAISELFEIGKEIVTYTDLSDLKNKLNYYLDPKNEAERQQIIEAGYKRVINEHTYKKRLTEMLKIIN